MQSVFLCVIVSDVELPGFPFMEPVMNQNVTGGVIRKQMCVVTTVVRFTQSSLLE